MFTPLLFNSKKNCLYTADHIYKVNTSNYFFKLNWCIIVKIQIDVLFCPHVHVYWNSVHVTSYPPRLYPARSHCFKKQFNNQSNVGPLCANTNMEMIDSALCKWTLYGFCQLMGLEPCQKRYTPLMSTLPSSSNHEMLRSST